MAIELIRDTIRIDRVIGESSSQALVEGDINVPDNKMDIATILDVDGRINVNSVEVVEDKILMDGNVSFHILYIGDGEGFQLTGMDATTTFSHSIDVQGARPKMLADVTREIEHIEFSLTNSRKINVKAVVNFEAKVISSDQINAVKEIRGLEDVQILEEKVQNRLIIGKGSSQTIIREAIEIPPEMPSIQEILKNEGKAVIKEITAADNKVTVEGDLVISTFYRCGEEREPLQYMTNTLPFSHFTEINGVYPGAEVEAGIEVQEIFVELRENVAGEQRIMELEILLNVESSAEEVAGFQIMADAYSPTVDLKLKKQSIESLQSVGENSVQNVIKESLQLSDDLPAITKILAVEGKPFITDQTIDHGKVTVEGIMDTKAIYLTGDEMSPVAMYQTELPFRYDLELENLKPGMDVDLSVDVDHVSFSPIASDEMELRFVINSRGKVLSKAKQEVIMEVEELEAASKDDLGGIIIYFTQPGDSLWSVAKRFSTTIAGILKYNPNLDQQDLVPGTRIVVYKKFTPVA
jgi:hypothetical protein